MRARRPSTPVLAGMSHVEAVARAASESDDELKVVNLNQRPDIYKPPRADLSFRSPLDVDPRHLFLSIGGNYHNILGLIENPVPFSVGDGRAGATSHDEKRHFVPEALMRAHFERHQAHRADVIASFARRFKGVPTHHLAPPPPVADLDGVRERPGAFRPHIHRGFAPPELRLKLYEIELWNLSRICDQHGIEVVPSPAEAFDKDGFLRADLCNQDPSHGNITYGQLVLQQVRELTRERSVA